MTDAGTAMRTTYPGTTTGAIFQKKTVVMGVRGRERWAPEPGGRKQWQKRRELDLEPLERYRRHTLTPRLLQTLCSHGIISSVSVSDTSTAVIPDGEVEAQR